MLLAQALVLWFWSRGERFIAANGPTFDEPAHLAAGYGYWTAGAFKLNPEHPPLLKLLWSVPLLFGKTPAFPREVASETSLNHWYVANAWMYESGVSPRQLLDPARRVNLALGCGLVLLVGWVAYRVWGTKLAGVAASAFAASDPTLLAMSCVLTTDIGLSLFGFSTCYLVWEYVARPSRTLLLAVGLSLGLMLGTKFSAVGIVAGLGLAGLVFLLRGGSLALPSRTDARGLGPAVELLMRLGVIASIVLAATYAFIYFPEWGKGLKFQLTRGSHGDGVMYLNGELSGRGWYHYFLIAMALKLPLGLLLAASAGAVSLFAQSHPRGRAVFLFVPPLVYFILASYSRVDLGIRVMLPVMPFLYLLAGGLAAPGCCRAIRLSLLIVSLAWCIYAAGDASPYEIAYFNELVGGPETGSKYLADSNLDWGQGLPSLRAWMDREGVDSIYLGYFGTDRPEAHGIRFQPLPCYGRVGPPGGEKIPANAARHIVAVSVNHLLGLYLNDPDTYAWLRDRRPTAVIGGGSIYVFDLGGDAKSLARLQLLDNR